MVILLKKLSLKSTIQAGKNKGLLVGEVMRKCKLDLIYTYFHYSNLSFTDDVLDQLHIKPEDIIPKPGKCPEKYHFYQNRNRYKSTESMLKDRNYDDDYKRIVITKVMMIKNKSKQRARIAGMLAREKLYFSKGAMQYRNHK